MNETNSRIIEIIRTNNIFWETKKQFPAEARRNTSGTPALPPSRAPTAGRRSEGGNTFFSLYSPYRWYNSWGPSTKVLSAMDEDDKPSMAVASDVFDMDHYNNSSIILQ